MHRQLLALMYILYGDTVFLCLINTVDTSKFKMVRSYCMIKPVINHGYVLLLKWEGICLINMSFNDVHDN